MSEAWVPEHVVGAAEADALVARQFPDLGPVRSSQLASGWDNTTFLVNDEWVFRFPRRTIAVDLIRTEARVLPVIAPLLSVPVPVPRWLGEPSEAFPWPFLGYRRIPGAPACRAGLDDESRESLAEPLAAFLAHLHSISDDAFKGLGLPADRLGRLDIGARRQSIRERLATLEQGGAIESVRPWEALLDEIPAAPSAAGRTVVHGDLHSCHLLVSGDAELSGVIDWGDVHRGHAAVDLAIAHSFLPPPARATFVAAYGGVDDEAWALARARAFGTAVAVAAYAAAIGDRTLLREGLVAMHHVLP